MKAITLHQPYASLIATGKKTIETRSRTSPLSTQWRRLLGRHIAIHAGKACGPEVRAACVALTPHATSASIDEYAGLPGHCIIMWRERDNPYCADELLAGTVYPLGEVVATARLARVGYVDWPSNPATGTVRVQWCGPGAFQVTDGRCDVDEYGDFSAGRCLWEFADVEPLSPPVPAKGRQGIWDWEGPA